MSFISKKMSWQRPPAPVIGGRWSRWARSMSGRHRQVVSKHRFVVMALLRRSVPLYFSSHRWELKAWTLFPRINLAIDVRPQSFVFKTSLLSRAAQAQRARHMDQHRELEVSRGEKSLALQRTQKRNSTASAGIDSETVVVTPSILNVSDLSGRTALDRVFRRLTIQESETRTRGFLSKEALNIVHRITEERRRVEERRQTPTVLRQERPASLSEEQMNEIAGRSTNQISTLDRFGGNIRNADAMPSPFTPNFNLQQLTDHVIRQIDDRIIAYKERMGKLF